MRPCLLLTLGLLLASVALAQDYPRSADLPQGLPGDDPPGAMSAQDALDALRSGLLGLGPTERRLLDGFSLAEQGHLALVRQEGAGHRADLSQVGAGHLAVVGQHGTGIVASVAQEGAGNVVGLRLEGAGISLGTPSQPGVTQIGEGNVYLLEYAGAGALLPTVQVGQDNQAVQVGASAQAFGVQQYGNGLSLIVRHNGTR